MPRFHNIDGKKIQFTQDEEDAWDAEEKEWNDAAPARAWASLRKQRNKRLAETDWMATSVYTMSDAWKTYRKKLRDLPSEVSDPTSFSWPTKPS